MNRRLPCGIRRRARLARFGGRIVVDVAPPVIARGSSRSAVDQSRPVRTPRRSLTFA